MFEWKSDTNFCSTWPRCENAPVWSWQHFPPQEEWIKGDYWPREFNKLVEVVAASISYFDNISIDDSINLFCKTYPLKLPYLNYILINRIKEANLLGYSYERINRMQIILKDLEI